MSRTSAIALSGLVGLMLAGCDEGRRADAAALEARIAQTQVNALKTTVDELNARIAVLERQSGTATNYDEPSFAIIGRPTDAGFAVGRSGFGMFAVSVKDIQPYGAGSQLTLRTLNLAAATVKDATFTVNYNQYSLEDRLEQIRSGDAKADEKTPEPVTVASTNEFPPNQWVTQFVNVPNLPPDKIKFVSVAFKPSVLSARP